MRFTSRTATFWKKNIVNNTTNLKISDEYAK